MRDREAAAAHNKAEVCKEPSHKQGNKPWRVRFQHQGRVQSFGSFATAEEAAWEQDLKRLELGYEDEGFYNCKLQLGQGNTTVGGGGKMKSVEKKSRFSAV